MTMLEKLRTALILLLLPPIVGVEWSAVGAEISLFRSPQDSLQRAIEEHHWAYQNLIAPHYEAPSLLALQYATSLSSVETLFSSRRGAGISPLAEGASRSQFQINCTSLFHLDSLSSVWGRATYISASSQNVQGRETAHYPLTAPYTSIDTIGGFLDGECYTFSGGYSHAFPTRWRWGIEGGYEAYQESRDRDPRVLNTSGDLTIKTGLSYKFPSYYLGLSLSGRIYKQVHQMSFMNPLGAQFVFNLLGFDEYSLRFLGNAEAKAFNAYGYGVEGDLLPVEKKQGQQFFATAKYHYLGMEFTLKNRNELRLSYLRQHRLNLTVSYLSTTPWGVWALSNRFDLERRFGDESVYGMQEGISYPLLSVESKNYRSLYLRDDLEGVFSFQSRRALWELLPSVRFELFQQERKSSGALEQYSHLTPGVSLRCRHAIDRQLRFALRAQVGLEHRFSLRDALLFGPLPVDEFYHPFTKKLRSLAEMNHKIQVMNQAHIKTSLGGEYLLPSRQASLYAQTSAALCSVSRRVTLYKLQVSLGLLF